MGNGCMVDDACTCMALYRRGRAGAGNRALVIESDFTMGNRSDSELQKAMDAAWARADEEYTSVGWCDLRQSSEPMADGACGEGNVCDAATVAERAGCLTAYIMHASLANTLVSSHVCLAADALLAGVCIDHPTPGDWVTLVRSRLGMTSAATCSWMFQPALTPGTWFRGVFQQDFAHYIGSHQGTKKGQAEEKPEPQ